MACRHGASLRVADEKASRELERETERDREREERERERRKEEEGKERKREKKTSTRQDSKAAGTCLRRWCRIVAREIRRKDAITNRIINEVFTGVCIAPGTLISGNNRPFPSSSSSVILAAVYINNGSILRRRNTFRRVCPISRFDFVLFRYKYVTRTNNCESRQTQIGSIRL